MTLAPGQRLSSYQVLAPLGAGAMGEVYRARDTRLEREVAIKVLPADLAADPERLARFEREARALASLNHPNVAAIYGVDRVDGVSFLVLELVPGEDLARRLERAALPIGEALDVGRQIAEGLEAAHEAGVVHRDLKPANLALTPDGVVKILDLGLAKSMRAAGAEEGSASAATRTHAATVEGQILGSPSYMSPEQARGLRVDKRTDVWAFGCVLYECLSGEKAFGGASFADLVRAILDRDPDWSRLPAGVPPSVRRLLTRCLEKNDRERLRDVGEARVILGRAQRPDAAGDPDAAPPEPAGTAPVARSLTLKTEVVRSLESPSPRMVGDAMTYLDNERDSDVLVVLLHGLGLDERMFDDVLTRLPYRAVAPSLYGFGPAASNRLPLSMSDHDRLLAVLIREIERGIRHTRVILAGFSAGADQALSLLSSPSGTGLSFDGLLLMSPSARLGMAPLSQAYAELPEPGQILGLLKGIGAAIESLPKWLRMHDYFVQAFGKFGRQPDALRHYARQLIEPLARDPDLFFAWFRAALAKTHHLRCVFAAEERDDVEWILGRHLEADLLGPDYREEMIEIAAAPHLLLADHSVICPYIDEVVSLVTRDRAPR